MKRIIIVALIGTLLTACSDYNKEVKQAYFKTVLVLNKQSFNTKTSTIYLLQLYNGSTADWYDTNEKAYNSIKVGDSITTTILEVVRYQRTVSDSIVDSKISTPLAF